MKLPLAHLDATVIEEVPVALWAKVFEAVGWPASLTTRRTLFNHEDVLTAFEQDDPSDELLQALEALHDLGTESGREAIATAMNDRRMLPGVLPQDVGEREFALHLFLAQRSDAAMVEVFARAQAEVQEGAEHRRYNEFMGKDARGVTNLTARRDTLEDETRRYCLAQNLGEHVHVRAFEDDGAFVFNIVRSHHTRKPLAVIPGRTARATITYRPVHGDILRYDSTSGRLRIAARAASVVEFYRRTLGAVLFNDELFFTGEPVCSLAVLQREGRLALDRHEIPGIGRVRMTECLWERGDSNYVHFRSRDCFVDIEQLHLPFSEGDVLQAKLKIEVAGTSTRPLTVNIRVPSRIEISKKAHEALVDEYLTAIGVRNAVNREQTPDLWSLRPWRHPRETWRAVFGAATDLLIRKRVLAPVRLDAVPHPSHPGAGRVLFASPTPGGDYYGVSRVPEIPSMSVSRTDLDGFELAPDQLRQHLRAELHLSGPAIVMGGSDVLDLGVLEVGSFSFRLFYALSRPPAGTAARLRALAAGIHPVVLVPTSVDDGSEIAKVVLGEALPARQALVRGVVAACGLTDQVPAVFSAPPGSRLVVDTRLQKVWLDGVEIGGLRPGTHPFRLVEALARACPRAVSTSDLAGGLSGARRDGDTTARQAKTEAKKCFVEAMAAAGRSLDADDLFPTGPTGYYRCSVPAHVA